MHKLLDYICEEMEALEQKVGKSDLSMQDIQLLDTLAHTKKNLLKCQEMEEMEYSSYRGGGSSRGGGSYARSYEGSSRGGSYDGGSYRRSSRRDSMGRYARADEYEKEHERMMERLKQIMQDTPDERSRRMLNDLVAEMS